MGYRRSFPSFKSVSSTVALLLLEKFWCRTELWSSFYCNLQFIPLGVTNPGPLNDKPPVFYNRASLLIFYRLSSVLLCCYSSGFSESDTAASSLIRSPKHQFKVSVLFHGLFIVLFLDIFAMLTEVVSLKGEGQP